MLVSDTDFIFIIEKAHDIHNISVAIERKQTKMRSRSLAKDWQSNAASFQSVSWS